VTLKVEYGPAAEEDIRSIFNWIADTDTAIAYVERIRSHCDRLRDFPNRGTRHDNIARGLKTLSFERRATIAYMVEADRVLIVRVLHKGRDINREFSP
jgi:toxin ParE1/3/4